MSSVSSSNSSDVGSAKYYRTALRDLEAETEKEKRRLRENQESEIQRLEEQYKTKLKKNEEETQKAVEVSRNESKTQLEREQERYKNALDQLRESTYDARGKLGNSVPVEIYKKELQSALDSAEMRHERDLRNFEDREDAFQHRIRENQFEHENRLGQLQENYSDELKKVREGAKDQILKNYEETKQAKEEILNQTADRDNRFRAQIRQLDEANTQQRIKHNDQLERQNRFSQERQAEALREKDEYYTDVIHQKDLEDQNSRKEIKDSFTRQIEEQQKKERRSEERFNQSLVNQAEKAEEARYNALAHQSKNYADTLADLKKNYEEKFERLKQSQDHMLNREGIPQVSIAAEEAIRKSFAKEYSTSLDAEIERNKNATEHAQRTYAENVENLLTSAADKETKAHQGHEKEKAEERFQFFHTVDEIQNQSTTRSREQKLEHEKEVQDLYREFGRTLEKQKRDSDYAMHVAQSSANDKITELRQEILANSKQASRTLSERQNELIREYEKKLTDLKSDYESQIDELKSQNLREMRDLDRKSKQELETQAKAFEQRLLQGEAQSRERERSIIQSYQNELDRTRRSYELRGQKKS